MSSGFSDHLKSELLDDFYAECDEQLANLRVQLTALEKSLAANAANPVALESLYRSVHSFKGNAGIVGLASAEELAHAAEGLLRSLTRAEVTLDNDTLELLGQVALRLEHIVTQFRLKGPLPAASDLLAQLAPYQRIAAAATDHVVPLPAPTAAPSVAVQPGMLAWRATFSPLAELDRRGVNVGSIRARLAALGRIVSATPSIQPGGSMTFEFVLALKEVPADLAAWEADGVTLRPENVETTPVATPADPAGALPSSLFIAPSHVVRVDLSRLDELMRIAGEMVIQRSRLEERIAQVDGDRGALQEVNLALARSLRDLRESITRVRLVPVAEIFSRLPFVVRDLGRDMGKSVRLVLEGQDTEIDKYLVERLKEPLLHLVRNAISHGVEAPAERIAAGKPESATLLLRATALGDAVQIQIRDDGRGIDASFVAQRATAAGLAVPDQLDETALLRLICTPGFSTRDEADRAAGRGVGMAVVATTVRELGGTLTLATEAGRSTQFTLRLPLTLSIAETFIVSAGGRQCAVPQGMIEEIVRLPVAHLRTIQQVEVAPYRDGLLPLVRLSALLGTPATSAADVSVLVVNSERGSTGLLVDRVHGQREVVVRPLQDPLLRVPGISGATELGDGKPILILDPAALGPGAVRPTPPALARSA